VGIIAIEKPSALPAVRRFSGMHEGMPQIPEPPPQVVKRAADTRPVLEVADVDDDYEDAEQRPE